MADAFYAGVHSCVDPDCRKSLKVPIKFHTWMSCFGHILACTASPCWTHLATACKSWQWARTKDYAGLLTASAEAWRPTENAGVSHRQHAFIQTSGVKGSGWIWMIRQGQSTHQLDCPWFPCAGDGGPVLPDAHPRGGAVPQ